MAIHRSKPRRHRMNHKTTGIAVQTGLRGDQQPSQIEIGSSVVARVPLDKNRHYRPSRDTIETPPAACPKARCFPRDPDVPAGRREVHGGGHKMPGDFFGRMFNIGQTATVTSVRLCWRRDRNIVARVNFAALPSMDSDPSPFGICGLERSPDLSARPEDCASKVPTPKPTDGGRPCLRSP